MKFVRLLTGLVVIGAMASPSVARGETAEQAFANGNTLLKKGSFQEALKAYSTAAREDRANQQYGQQFMLVRRIVALRENLDRERDSERWPKTAQSLRSFYISQGIYSEALTVDEQIHARLNTASSAGQLAETQLAMGKDAEASRVLSAVAPEKATIVTQALLGIALARQGQVDKAKEIVAKTTPPEKAGPGPLYSLARMYAVVGNSDETLKMLTRCFEAAPPSQLDAFKKHSKICLEFSDLSATEGFAAVLQTKSKIAESKCSLGSSCAGCPMRGGCQKSEGE